MESKTQIQEQKPCPVSHLVFVSHADEDSQGAEKIVAALEKAAFPCWTPRRDVLPGENWGDTLCKAIESSRLVLVLLTSASNRSPFVLRDVLLAVARQIPVLPVRIASNWLSRDARPESSESGNTTPDFAAARGPMGEQLQSVVKSMQIVDASKGPIESHLQSIVRAVRLLVPCSAGLPEIQTPSRARPAGRGYVFISYSKADAEFVERLKGILKRRGYAYWDYSESERDYHSALFRELEAKIEGAAAFMGVITDSWRDSEWPAAEYIYAKEAKVPVFVLQAKHMSRPVPIILNQQTRIDMASDFDRGALVLEHELDKKGL